MIGDLAQSYMVQFDALATSGAIARLCYHSFVLLLAENLSGAATYEFFGIFLVIEVSLNFDVGHQSVETSGDRRPFCMLFSDALLSVDLKVDFLIFA